MKIGAVFYLGNRQNKSSFLPLEVASLSRKAAIPRNDVR